MKIENIRIRDGHSFGKLQIKTPIGIIDAPEWEAEKLYHLSDEKLLQQAISEHKTFCISPTTFAMIERRFLSNELQKRINPQVGVRHDIIL